jgi:hypothetical protein
MDKIFIDKAAHPTDAQLKSTLGRSFTYFENLQELTRERIQEWKFYNKKSGWIFKVSNKKRSIFYLAPYEKVFLIAMTVNEADRATLLESKIDKEIKSELESAKKYPEGYPLRKHVKTRTDLNSIIKILKILERL